MEVPSREQVVELLKTDVTKFNEMRLETGRKPIDLSGVDLSGQDLGGADLGRCNLTGSNLRGANLQGAATGGAILDKADFRDTNLVDCNFHHCNMRGVDLRGATLTPLLGGMGKMCVNAHSFEGVRYDKEHLAKMIEALNLNSDWQIKYEIVPRS